ncbi:hypothetical protein [Mycolicibacterium aichiense]|nr:hypothetical protein [Mycolicibacterium aichiense]
MWQQKCEWTPAIRRSRLLTVAARAIPAELVSEIDVSVDKIE